MTSHHWPPDATSREVVLASPTAHGRYDRLTSEEASVEMDCLTTRARIGQINLALLATLYLEMSRASDLNGWRLDLIGWARKLDYLTARAA